MANKRDYYEVLGLARGASQDDVKRAYRQMARRYHPDANPGDPTAADRFKEINEANEVLSDPDKRARYDQFGHAGVGAAGGDAGGPFGFGDFSGGFAQGAGFEDIFDAFSSVFGNAAGSAGRSRRAGPERGADLRVRVEVSFNEAAFGCERRIDVPRAEACKACGGTGGKGGARPQTCAACHGQGQVRVARSMAFGQFVTVQACPRCGGTGQQIGDPCDSCGGKGTVQRRNSVTVHIPPGVDNGARLRLRGEGGAGNRGGGQGDLYVDVQVQPHPRFRRDGHDVVSELKIGIAQAALGADVEVETLDGTVALHVPAGTQPGASLTVPGRHGIPNAHGHQRGDHRVVVGLEVPKHLTEAEREALHRFADLRGETVDGGKGFVRRILGR